MPKYRVTKPSYIGGISYPASADGAEVIIDYDGNPGTNLEPIDDEGRARQTAYYKSKGITPAIAARRAAVLTDGAADLEGALEDEETRKAKAAKKPAGPSFDHVAIPDGWADLNAKDSVDLAAKLGAPVEVTTKAAAQEFIAGVVAVRTTG